MQQLKEFFEQGGFFMYVNLLCSVVTITLIVDRARFFLVEGAVNARAFLEQLRKLLTTGQTEKAQRLCAATTAPVALVARAGLGKLQKGEGAVSTAIEEALVDVTPELKKRIGVLWSLANIATLIGLLGTINGLIGGFAAIGKAAADQRSSILASRIAEAMNNTWLGLAIAATCMIGHLFLSMASKKQQQELESFSLKLENLLVDIIHNPPAPAAPVREERDDRDERESRRRPDRVAERADRTDRTDRDDRRRRADEPRRRDRYRDEADEDEGA
ncbi:MAG: MotA/TolQ/ExbB proton channel family protein [Polyangia bacterium]